MAQAWQSDELLAQPFVFRRGGVRTLNRIVKGALSENLADPSTNLPNEALCLLYVCLLWCPPVYFACCSY